MNVGTIRLFMAMRPPPMLPVPVLLAASVLLASCAREAPLRHRCIEIPNGLAECSLVPRAAVQPSGSGAASGG